MYNACQTTDFKKVFSTKQHTKKNPTERHGTHVIPVVSCGEDNESGNDDWESQSGETSTHDDDDDNEDSYSRQVKEIQRKAISRFPVRYRAKSCRLLQVDQSRPFKRGFTKIAPVTYG